MRSEQNTIGEETGRGQRTGTLTQTTFTPFFKSFASFVPKRAALVVDKDDIKAAGTDLKARIKAELAKRRAQQLKKELRQRRRQQFVTLPLKKIQELMATYELPKRGRQMRRMLQKRNRKLQKQWQRQFQQQQKARRSFWIALGFGLGLTLAGIITYQLLRQRLQQQNEEEASLELPQTDTSLQQSNVTNAVPPDAVFVGVTSAKLYYPIETSLDQLLTKDDLPADIIYFVSEQEASQQGFQPAQPY
jgi:hypothetical protein